MRKTLDCKECRILLDLVTLETYQPYRSKKKKIQFYLREIQLQRRVSEPEKLHTTKLTSNFIQSCHQQYGASLLFHFFSNFINFGGTGHSCTINNIAILLIFLKYFRQRQNAPWGWRRKNGESTSTEKKKR